MKHINEIYDMIKDRPPKILAVASSADEEVLMGVTEAKKLGIVKGQLYGDAEKTAEILKKLGEDPAEYEIIHTESEAQAGEYAVKAVREGRADILMKGFMGSSDFIRTMLNKEYGIRDGHSLLSAMAVTEFEIDGEDKVVFIVDPGFNPAPDLEAKKTMIKSALKVMNALGYDEPKVAVLSAAEVVNPKMVSSTDAKALEEMGNAGEFGKCIVGGPFSFDLAVSPKSAAHKGFKHPVAGCADLLVVPNLEAGNAMLKAIFMIGGRPGAGAVCGTTKPVVFTSRSDLPETKRNTIAIAAILAEGMK